MGFFGRQKFWNVYRGSIRLGCHELILARDPGEKPLYYTTLTDGTLLLPRNSVHLNFCLVSMKD